MCLDFGGCATDFPLPDMGRQVPTYSIRSIRAPGTSAWIEGNRIRAANSVSDGVAFRVSPADSRFVGGTVLLSSRKCGRIMRHMVRAPARPKFHGPTELITGIVVDPVFRKSGHVLARIRNKYDRMEDDPVSSENLLSGREARRKETGKESEKKRFRLPRGVKH